MSRASSFCSQGLSSLRCRPADHMCPLAPRHQWTWPAGVLYLSQGVIGWDSSGPVLTPKEDRPGTHPDVGVCDCMVSGEWLQAGHQNKGRKSHEGHVAGVIVSVWPPDFKRETGG